MTLKELIKDSSAQLDEIKVISAENEELLHKKPEANRWSALEVIEHLNRTHKLYLQRLEEVISKSEKTDEPMDEYGYSFGVKYVIEVLKPKNGKRRMKMKTFSVFQPSDNLEANEVMDMFFKDRTELQNLIEETRFIDHSKLKINSPLRPILKFKLGEAYEFLLAHEKRHILQIRETLQLLN
jgi:hypothetical protein